MFELDSRTLLVVMALISVGSAVVLAYLWRVQSQRKGAGLWVAGMSCIAVTSLLICGRGILPDGISYVLASSLLALGFVLILRGIRVFIGRPQSTRLDFGLFPLLVFSYVYFSYVEQRFDLGIISLSTLFIIICVVAVSTLLHEKTAPWRSISFCAAFAFAVFGLANVARIMTVLSAQEQAIKFESVAISYVWLGGILIIGGIAISLILLTYATLESELRIFSLAVEHSASSIVITDREGNIEYVNSAVLNKTGYLKEELIGQNPRVLKSGEMDSEGYASLWRTISQGGTWQGEFHNR
jgi:PAS domain-containing protein